MPNQAPILVTGASGYVASWVVHELLSRGHTVHGTVRDPSNAAKTQHLTNLNDTLPGTLRLFAADLLDKGSFAEAMAGCETVIHTASPFLAGANADPQANLVRPALDGTRNVLETANTVDSVLRVVLTSSVVATYGDLADAAGRTITEDDWNTTSTLDHQPYPYSKTLAEKAAWEAEAAQERWKLVVVNPSFVMGPSLSNRNDGTSVDFMLNNLKGTWKTGTLPMQTAFVDVREVAFAHVEAALRPDAAGRHLLVSEVMSLYAFGQLIEAEHPGRFGVPAREVPTFLARLLGPFLGFSMKYISRNGGHPLSLDNTRSKERLGVNYRPLLETVRDHIAQIERDGML